MVTAGDSPPWTQKIWLSMHAARLQGSTKCVRLARQAALALYKPAMPCLATPASKAVRPCSGTGSEDAL